MATGEAAKILERAALDDLGLRPDLLNALQERGHSVDDIRAMGPQERFSEYCQWEGLIGHASTLLAVARSAGVVLNSGTYSVIPAVWLPGGNVATQCPEAEATQWEIYELSPGNDPVMMRVEDSRASADKWVQDHRK